MPVYMVTGANRGLGLGLVTELLRSYPEADTVVAASRGPSEALDSLAQAHPGRVLQVRLDTSDEASIQAAAKELEGKLPGGLDVLINNAGVAGEDKADDTLMTTKAHMLHTFEVNVTGPWLTTQALLPALRKGAKKTIVNMSSGLGSVSTLQGSAGQGGMATLMASKYLTYRQSKAALNMQTAVLANALRDEGFTVLALAPGWVATDMGNDTAQKFQQDKPTYTVEESCRQQLQTIHALKPQDTGLYKDLTGKVLAP